MMLIAGCSQLHGQLLLLSGSPTPKYLNGYPARISQILDNGSDRLYSAAIAANGLGPAKLLATDELIRDAHWAYYKQ
jgi:hypothetical protein